MRKSLFIWSFVVLGILIITIAMIGWDFSGNPLSITGYSINTNNTQSDSINKTFESDSVYLWEPKKDTYLEGLAISGNISGEGSGKVFLIKDNEKILVKKFQVQNETRSFSEACEDSCDMKKSKEEDFLLRIKLDENAKLRINKIIYPQENSGIKSTTFSTNDLPSPDLNESVFYELKHLSSPIKSEDIILKIKNKSPVNGSRLNYKPHGEERWYHSNLSNEKGVINNSYLEREGSVEYFFNSKEHRFPENNNMILSITEGNPTFEEKAKNFVNNDPTSNFFCKPLTKEEYTCQLENLQSSLILSFATAYRMTGNETYIDMSNRLAVSPYDNSSGEGDARCDHNENDFDCEAQSTDQYNGVISGAKRQSSLIYSLWRSYQLGGNESVKRLAINYTEGSAEECDVWEGDFDCGKGEDQGLMMVAYWKAYEMTGDESYANIAINLSKKGSKYNDSVSLIWGFLKGYELSGENFYLNRSKKLGDKHIQDCRFTSCEPYKQSLNSYIFWELYETTEDYKFKRAALDKTYQSPENHCDPWEGEYRCENPEQQGWMSISYWKGYHTSKNISRGFYSPQIINHPTLEESLDISIKFNHDVSSPHLYYKQPKRDEFNKEEINQTTGKVSIDGKDLWKRGVYEYYFKDRNIRFPENGTFKFIISSKNETLENKATKMTTTNPLEGDKFCSFNISDNSCKLEYMQGWMNLGVSAGFSSTNNKSWKEKSISLSEREIDKTTDPNGTDPNGMHSTCDHADFDYDCNHTNPNFPSDIYRKSGAKRQSMMILSLSENYLETRNEKTKDIMLNYARGSPEECNVWRGDFDCGKGEDQGLMMAAYWKVYEVTGEDKYKEIAKKLTNKGMDYDNHPLLAKGLMKTYGMTKNESVLNKSKSILSNISINKNISPKEQGKKILALWEGFIQTGQDSYKEKAKNLSFLKTHNELCNPNKGSYKCELPDEQGLMSKSLWESYDNYFIQENLYPFIINVSVDKQIKLKGKSHFFINLTNNETYELSDVKVKYNLSSGLNISKVNTSGSFYNNTIIFNKLSSSETVIINGSFVPQTTGEKNVNISFTSKGGGIYRFYTNISVNEEESTSSGGGGGSISRTECDDGIDNDGDGLIDMNDPGCTSIHDDNETYVCSESWSCTPWKECINGTKRRECYDTNSCGTEKLKPPVKKDCKVDECKENWTCENWEECINGTKRRECYDTNSCDSKEEIPIMEKECEVEKKTNISEIEKENKFWGTFKGFILNKGFLTLILGLLAITGIIISGYYNRLYIQNIPFYFKWEVIKRLGIGDFIRGKKKMVRRQERYIFSLLKEAKDKINEEEYEKAKELYEKGKEIYDYISTFYGYEKKMVAKRFIDNLMEDVQVKLNNE